MKDDDNMLCIFQKLINNKAFCYEIDYFSILIMVIQILTQNENILSEISNMNFKENDIMKYVDKYREENGLKKLENGSMWNKIFEMLLMRGNNNDNNDEIYNFDKLSIDSRRNYLKQCYNECSLELMDLENLSPKLQKIMVKLDSIMFR